MAQKFDIKNISGLSETQALNQLKKYGFNELLSSKPKSVLTIILDVVKEPMFILLVTCGTLYMLLGDIGEGFMLLASVIIIIIITFYQEKKTERALEALRELSSPRALVVRDGIEKRIAGRQVVIDDIILLQEGDRIPADAYIIEELNLKIDESLLTGESVSVKKNSWNGTDGFGGPDRGNFAFIYSGTMIVQGSGIAKVAAIGVNTELGKIGKSLNEVREEQTLLQKETSNIVKIFSIVGFGLCIILILIYGIIKHDWLHGILTGLSLAMSLLPEEFAVVLTIFMAMGAWRISQKNVLTRKASSIETLGSVTVLCTDKTGTLTQNKMSVKKVFANGKAIELNAEPQMDLNQLLEYGILSSQINPFDPMEKAIIQAGEGKLKKDYTHANWQMVKEYPLSSKLLAMTHVYKSPEKAEYIVAAKGAPEAIADLCHLSTEKWENLEQEVKNFASDGLRVLGVAKAVFNTANLPETQHDFDFEFLGFIALEDPLRVEVPENLKSCYEAGIRVIMITGDYPVTAQNIAKQMGLNNPDECI
jgi:Ca2+-transporting ATPase